MAFNLADVLKDMPKSGTDREQIEYIRLDRIEEDPNNFYQLSGIEELAANIQLCGLQQPIRVRPISGETERYMIVSGHRRRKAVELLAKDEPERWEEVPCIVEEDAIPASLQQLRLICANANTRTMTSAEVSEQAEQAKKLLYQLKEEGYEFPGRMRDHVAEVVNVSKSKLARLKVIRDKLSAVWEPSWKKGDLGESSAYALAQMPKAYQNLLFEEKNRTNANIKYLYADDIKKFGERAAAIEKLVCKETGGECENCERKLRKATVAERYGWFHCDNKCCKDCPELSRCKAACPRLAETVEKLKADAKEAAKQEKLAQAEKDRPAVERISALWQRFGLCRGMADKSIEDCKEAMGLYFFPFDETKAMQLECGEAKISATSKLPYGMGCYLPEINRLVNLADLFGVSLDYLLCRTDVRELAVGVMPDSGTEEARTAYIPGAWYPVSVEPPVGKRLILIDSDWIVDDGKYIGYGEYTMDYGAPVAYWTLAPDPSAAPAAAPVPSGWRGGEPEAYGTYAAYVQVDGAANPLLKELLWDGEEWFLLGSPLADHAKVLCWAERPEVLYG